MEACTLHVDKAGQQLDVMADTMNRRSDKRSFLRKEHGVPFDLPFNFCVSIDYFRRGSRRRRPFLKLDDLTFAAGCSAVRNYMTLTCGDKGLTDLSYGRFLRFCF